MQHPHHPPQLPPEAAANVDARAFITETLGADTLPPDKSHISYTVSDANTPSINPSFVRHMGDHLRGQHGLLPERVAADAGRLALHNRSAGYDVVDSRSDLTFVSEAVAQLLRECYGGTFPIPAFTEAGFVKNQITGGGLTSFVLREQATGKAVGTSSLRHFNRHEWFEAYREGEPIAVELARSASVSSGAAVSELMQARQAYLFGNDWLLTTHAAVFGDSRASVGRMLPNGHMLPGSARTQHSILKNGLKPQYVHAKLSFGEEQVHEPFLRYELAFDQAGVLEYMRQHPIYIPSGAEGLSRFVADTLDLAGLPATVVSMDTPQGPLKNLRVKDNGVYFEASLATQSAEAETSSVASAATLVDLPGRPSAMVVRIPAEADNMTTMYKLLAEGFTATGVTPGTSTTLYNPDGMPVPYGQPHCVIFTKNRRGLLHDAPEMELPQELEAHPIAQSSRDIWATMRRRNV